MRKKKEKVGRKSVDPPEKVILVGFYTKQKFVDFVGGLANARKLSKENLEAEMYSAKAIINATN